MLERFKENSAGIREAALQSAGVAAHLERYAQQVAATASARKIDEDITYVVETEVGPNRARAAVVSRGGQAEHEEVRHRTLGSSVGRSG